MTMTSKFTAHKLQLKASALSDIFLLTHYMPINYDTLSIDFMDTEGQKMDVQVGYKYLTDTCIELTLDKIISGVFLLRLRDEKSFLMKKVII